MKKIILIGILLFQLAFVFGQKAQWGSYTKISCYQGFSFALINYGYNKYGNGYEWNWKVKSNYNRKVSFNVSLKIGNDKKDWGRFTLDPYRERTHVTFYYNSPDKQGYLEITDVCFSDNYLDNCWANCDQGTPNQPVCNGSSKSNNNNNNSNSANQSNNSTQQNDPTFDRNNASYQDYYKRATAAGQAGNYDEAIRLWNSAISVAVNDDQRNNARAWLVEVQKAKGNSTNNNNLQKQQEIQRQQQIIQQQQKQQQELQRQQQLQQGLTQLADGITGLAASIKANKERKRLEARQEALSKDLAERQLMLDADNGVYDAQIKVAEKYFTDSKYDLAESFYFQALQNSTASDYQKSSILDEIITTLALQEKNKEVFEIFDLIKKNKIYNSDADRIMTYLKLHCKEFCTDYLNCNDSLTIEGVKELNKIKNYGNPKALFAYLQATGDCENFGIPKDEKIGLNTLDDMSSEKHGSYKTASYYYLGMLYLNGTSTIEVNEKKALKYFLKGYDGKEKEMDLIPAYSKYKASEAFFNYKLLTYLKIAGLYSKSKDKDDRETSETMRRRFYKWYKGMIPNSDKSIFKEFSNTLTSITPISNTINVGSLFVQNAEEIQQQKIVLDWEYVQLTSVLETRDLLKQNGYTVDDLESNFSEEGGSSMVVTNSNITDKFIYLRFLKNNKAAASIQQFSQNTFPYFPVNTLLENLKFIEVTTKQKLSSLELSETIAKEIAQKGEVKLAIIFDNGNMLGYKFFIDKNNFTGALLIEDLGFKKKGEFSPNDYEIQYTTTHNFSISQRSTSSANIGKMLPIR